MRFGGLFIEMVWQGIKGGKVRSRLIERRKNKEKKRKLKKEKLGSSYEISKREREKKFKGKRTA